MSSGLTARLFVALFVAALLASLVVGAFFDAARGRAVHELREIRHTLLLSALRQRLEVSLSLGLDAQSLARLQVLAEAEVGADPSILSIDVFDDRGRLILTTDAVGVGNTVPASWVLATSRGERLIGSAEAPHPFRVRDEAELAIGVPIVSDFGSSVGGLVLRRRVDAEGARADNGGMALLAPAIIAGALGGGFFAFGFVWFLSYRLNALARALVARLQDAARQSGDIPQTGSSQLEAAAAAMTASLTEIDRRSRVARSDLERIDAQP